MKRMSCEMCRTFVGPDIVEAEVDGVRMLLCRKCSKFGTKTPSKPNGVFDDSQESEVTFVKSKPGGKGPSVSHVKVKTGSSQQTSTERRRRYRDSLDSDEVLIEDYGEVIKNARKAKGYSLEQFAQMIMQQMQQPQQPDAMTIAAMAEQTKAQSDMLDSQVKAYNAETQRAKVQIDAQKAGADIALKTAQTNGTELDNVLKFAGQQ